MHVSLQTLKSLVELPAVSAKELAKRLTLAGLEIESIKESTDDTIFELKVTPNRPDALSHFGVARELAAAFETRAIFPTPSVKELGASIHDLLQVHLLSKDVCLRYACRIVEGVSIAPSPEWLQKRLLSLNLKPINNVVDITNWVLLERGQPLHAFDLDTLCKVKGRVFVKIRRASPGEILETLDGKKRVLTESDLVIADEEKAIGLAGVMGGKNTEVSLGTQNVLLESAYFVPSAIRKTAKRLQMSTDASYRFERGTDPNGVIQALDRAAQLIQEIAGGRIRREVVDVYPKSVEPLEILLRSDRLAQLSALPLEEIEPARLRTRFLGLGIETCGKAGQETFRFRIPTFRPDIREEIDLIEEAMRLIGFSRVPEELQIRTLPNSAKKDMALNQVERTVVSFMSQAGFHEAINYAFGSPREWLNFQSCEPIALQNPLGEEFSVLRQSLVPGLLANVRDNLRQQIQKPNLFETGIVFLGKNPRGSKPNSEKISPQDMAPDAYAHEHLLLTAVMREGDFYALKGVLESLFKQLRVSVEFTPSKVPPGFLHPAQCAELVIEGQVLGHLGYLHPNVSEHAKDCVVELSLDILKNFALKTVRFHPLPKFPGIGRDLGLLIDETVMAADILKTIKNFKVLSHWLEHAEIFDVYQGKGIEAGKKSMAISLQFRDPEKTLTEAELEPCLKALIQELETKGASLRTY